MFQLTRPCSADRAGQLRINRFGLRPAILVFLFGVIPAFGHHSIASYDLVHGTILEGLVTAFVWENPHAHIYLDLAAENEVERWTIELESPKVLQSLGW